MTSRLLLALAVSLAALGSAAPAAAQRAAGPAAGVAGVRADDAPVLAALHVERGAVAALPLPRGALAPFELELRLGAERHALLLWPHAVRGERFELLAVGPGGAVQRLEPPPPSTLRGVLAGRPGSRIAASLVDGALRAIIDTGDGATWIVQPVPEGTASPGGPSLPPVPGGDVVAREHVTYRADEVLAPTAACLLAPPAGSSGWTAPPPGASPADSGPLVCEIACAADYEYHVANGSDVLATLADIESIVNACEVIYDAEAAIRYQLSTVQIQGFEPDPYSSSDPETLLDQMRAHWNASNDHIPRDVAHLFTGKDLTGPVVGIAYVDVICSASYAYGLSQSRFTANFASRVALTAHELGHNWSAGHCNGASDCEIMCSSLGGCGGIDGFGSASLASIEAAKAAAACLSEPQDGGGEGEGGGDPPLGPVLVSLAPAFGRPEGGELVVLGGSGFVDDPATEVRFDGVAAEIVAITAPDTIVARAPPGAAGHRVDVSIATPAGDDALDNAYSYEWSIEGGDRLESGLLAGDVDRAYLLAPGGSVLSAKLRATDDELVPGLRLVAPGELVLAEHAPGGPTARLEKVPLPASGTYRLELYGADGSAGGYRLVTALRRVTGVAGDFSIGPGDGPVQLTFTAVAGSELRSLVVKARKAKGAWATVEGLPADLQPHLAAIEPPSGGDLAAGLAPSVNKAGTALALGALPLPEFGDYHVVVESLAATVGHGRIAVRLRHPKATKAVHVVDAGLDEP